MCFFLQVEVVLQRDSPTARAEFRLPAPPPGVRFEGAFPCWHLTDGHCSCGLVKGTGKSIGLSCDVLRAMLAQDNVKRLHVLWYWGDDAPDAAEERLSIDEFFRRNDASELAQDVRYRINDPNKYAR